MRTPPPNILGRTFIALAAAAVLSGCVSPQREDPKTGAALATQQWDSKIAVNTYPDEVLLAVHADGLSLAQADALQAFLERWTQADAGVIRVRAPTVANRPGQADRMARAARDFLVARGAPAWRIEMAAYDAAGASPEGAPLVVAFDRHQVETPLCGTNMENLSRTAANQVSTNFGCAIASNIAAQLADPGDLINPRDMDSADVGRRATVLGKYRAGELTASPIEPQASGAVSKAVN